MLRRYDYFAQDPDFPAVLIIGTLFLGAFFGFLNETLLNVALTHIMHYFSIDKSTVQWMTTGFLLIMGALTPITANVIQWFSTRTTALLTLGIFLAGTVICAFTPNFPILLVGRLIQAIGAAIQIPLLMNVLLAIYPPQQRGRAMSLVAMIFTAAPAIGPTLSGFIVDHYGWRYLFIFTMPFFIAAMVIVVTVLKVNIIPTTKPRIDGLSALLAMTGFGSLVFAGSQFSHLTLPQFGGLFVAAIWLIVWFCRRQLSLQEPLLDVRAFMYPQYRYAMIILALAFFLFLGLELLLPMYMQQVLFLSATVTGLALLPASIVEAVFAPLFGWLLDRKGARYVMLPSGIIMAASFLALYASLDASGNTVRLAVLFACFAIAIASAITCETHGLNALPKHLNPHGTAIISTINPIAGALGAAFFVGVTGVGERFSTQATAPLRMLDGVHLACGCGVILTVVVLFFATRIRNR